MKRPKTFEKYEKLQAAADAVYAGDAQEHALPSAPGWPNALKAEKDAQEKARDYLEAFREDEEKARVEQEKFD